MQSQQSSVARGSEDIGARNLVLVSMEASRQKDKMATFVTLMGSRRKVVEQLFEKKRLDGIVNAVNLLF